MSTDKSLPRERLDEVLAVFAQLNSEHLEQDLQRIFHPDAEFKDPFNHVTGIAAIEQIFAHGFKQCPTMRFVVQHAACHQYKAYVHWCFQCQPDNPQGLQIDGVSILLFDAQGRVVCHHDYWDPAEQLYSRVPVLAGLLRWIKKRLQAG